MAYINPLTQKKATVKSTGYVNPLTSKTTKKSTGSSLDELRAQAEDVGLGAEASKIVEGP